MPAVPITVEVDWTNTGTWVDESASVTEVTIQRGRTSLTDQFGAGRATIRLQNQNGRFSPYHTGSPLSPNVIGGRPLRVTATYDGTTYDRFCGVTDEITQSPDLPATVEITCSDAFDGFSRQTPVLGLVTDQRVDQILTALLSAAGWSGTTDFEAGRTLPNYVATETTLLAELQTAVAQELGGVLFVDGSGALVFQNADHRPAATVWTTVTVAEQVTLAARQSDLISRVELSYSGYDATGAAGTIASRAPTRLAAQTSTTLSGTWDRPGARDAVEPEPDTDYTATDIITAAELYGAEPLDVTRQVCVWEWSTDAAGWSATLRNLLPYPVLLTQFAVRGTTPVTAVQPSVITAEVASPLVTNVPLQLSALWQDDVAALTAFAEARRDALGAQRPRPDLTLLGLDDATIVQILGAELSACIHLADVAATWTTRLDGVFFLEALEETYRAGEPPEARWTLFDTVQAGGGQRTVTARGVLSRGAATVAGTASHTPPSYTATGVLTRGAATVAGSGTTAALTYTATGVLTRGAATVAGSATFSTPPVRTPLGTNGTVSGTALSVPISTAIGAGECVVVGFLIAASATGITVTCGSDTFTIDLSQTGSTYVSKIARLLSAGAHAINTNVTIAWTGTVPCSMWVAKWSVAATALDKTASATGSSTAPSSGATPTTTQAAEILMATVGVEGVSKSFSAPGGGFTLGQTITSASLYNLAELYQAVAATGAYTASCTLGPTGIWSAALATYKV